MKPETKNALVKELEKMGVNQNKNNYNIAWYILMISIISMILFLTPLDRFISNTVWSVVFSIIILLCLLTVIFQSLFVIIRYIVDRRLRIFFETVLEKEGE
ncbi:MAG: hypothetical protein P4L45_03040 [Ignavibacteriaceae bacterium]|nr:hypothetical protein [Ignavibacteriaceae bacterium]